MTTPDVAADLDTVRYRLMTILRHEGVSAQGFAQHTALPQDTADYTVIAAVFNHFVAGLQDHEYDDLIRELANTGTTGATR